MKRAQVLSFQILPIFALALAGSLTQARAEKLMFEQTYPLVMTQSRALSISQADPAKVHYQTVLSRGINFPEYTRTAVFDPTSGRLIRTYAGTAEQIRSEQTLASANAYTLYFSSICPLACLPGGFILESFDGIGRKTASRYRGAYEFKALRAAGDFFKTEEHLRDPGTLAPINARAGCVSLDLVSPLNILLNQCGRALEARQLSDDRLLWQVDAVRPELRLSPDQRLIAVVGEDARVRILDLRGQTLAISGVSIGNGDFATEMIWANSDRLVVRTSTAAAAQLLIFSHTGAALSLLWQRADQQGTVAVDSSGRIYGTGGVGANGRFTQRLSADGQATERMPFFLGNRAEPLYRLPQVAATLTDVPRDRVLEAWDIDSLQRLWSKPQLLLPNFIRQLSFVRDSTIWSLSANTNIHSELQLSVMLHDARTGRLNYQSPIAGLRSDDQRIFWAASGQDVAALAIGSFSNGLLALFDAQGQLRWQNTLPAGVAALGGMSANAEFIAVHADANVSALLFDAQNGNFIRNTEGLILLPNGLALETQRFERSKLVQARSGEPLATLQNNSIFDASSRLIVGFESTANHERQAVVSNLQGATQRRIDLLPNTANASFVFDGLLIRSYLLGNESRAYDLRTGALRFRGPYISENNWRVESDRWRRNFFANNFARSAQVQTELNSNTGELAIRVLGIHPVRTRSEYIGQYQDIRIVVENSSHLLGYKNEHINKPWDLENKADVALRLDAIGGTEDALTFQITLSNTGPSATLIAFGAQALDERVELSLLSCSACNRGEFFFDSSRFTLAANTAQTLTFRTRSRTRATPTEPWDFWTAGSLNLIDIYAYADVNTLDPTLSNNRLSVYLDQAQIKRSGFEDSEAPRQPSEPFGLASGD